MAVLPPHYDEKTLLLLIAEADQSSFQIVYDYYKNQVYAFAFGITRSVPIAEEIVQDTFIQVWSNAGKLKEIQKFDSWLFVIARNYCYTALRKMALETKIRNHPYMDNESNDFSPEEILISKENQNIIKEAINNLSPQQSRVYQMRQQGKTYEEIAAELQISRNTVKEHVIRSNASIRNFLKSRVEMSVLFLLYFFLNA